MFALTQLLKVAEIIIFAIKVDAQYYAQQFFKRVSESIVRTEFFLLAKSPMIRDYDDFSKVLKKKSHSLR